MASDEQQLHIGGVRVKFPFKPYPTQLSMMAKIIQALNKKENALLESPTGSGKSLALLCASLAWQKSIYEKMNTENNPAERTGLCQCPCHIPSNAHPLSNDLTKAESKAPANLKGLGSSKDLDSTKGSESSKVTIGLGSVSLCGAVTANHSVLFLAKGTSKESAVASVAPSTNHPEDIGSHSTTSTKATEEEEGDDGNDDNGDFKPPTKRYRQLSPDRVVKCRRDGRTKGVSYVDPQSPVCDTQLPPSENGLPTWKMKLSSSFHNAPNECGFNMASTPQCQCCACATDAKVNSLPPQVKKPMDRNRSPVPKIFVCTRTHKQIAQLVRELSRTLYSSTPMTILASRDHTCIHPDIMDSPNKSEECTQLIRTADGPSCLWFHRVQTHMGTHAQLISHGMCTAWDIEDLVAMGKKTKACPYFASRSLLTTADVVFCPYNYIIDPNIRGQMGLDMKGHVVILDEAHNIEDSAREAASITLPSTQLLDVAEEIHLLMKLPSTDETKESYGRLMALCQNMAQWMEKTSSSLPQRGFEETCGIWSGAELSAILRDLGVTDTTLPLLEEAYRVISELAEQQTSLRIKDQISTISLSVLKGILIVYDFMFKEGQKYFNDYRVCLMRAAAFKKASNQHNGWRGKKWRNVETEKIWVINLHFWCMNPAVAFSGLLGAHSIILTSGTLSPIHSFSSELGVDFPIQLEANHVVPETQTWIYSISSGPSGHSLLANFQNSETYEFQDEVGAVVEHVCMTVPFGILCFLSSYKMLEKLVARWKQTGQWERVSQRKVIISEPRSGDGADFNTTMEGFYHVIETSHTHQPGSESGHDGALFLAVCRGKVSEGLDFADNNARAVITVGIPFPNFKDKQVELKREYNSLHSHSRGLLGGSEWYEIQAYRAINQALGRCIRHLKDWGALLLVDDRFSKGQNYTKGLSRWVRTRLGYHSDFASAMTSLKSFVAERIASDSAHLDTIHFLPQPVSCDPLDSTILASVIRKSPGNPSSHQAPPRVVATPNFAPTDITKQCTSVMASPGREWSATAMNQQKHSVAASTIPGDHKIFSAIPDQRLFQDVCSTLNSVAMASPSTLVHAKGLLVSTPNRRAFVSAPSPNSQMDLTDAPSTDTAHCLRDTDSKGPSGSEESSRQAPSHVLFSSPLLFDSAPPSLSISPVRTPHQKTLQSTPVPCRQYVQGTDSVVNSFAEAQGNSGDSDVTPPISPQQKGSPDAKVASERQHLLVLNHTKETSVEKPKKNVRIARLRSCIEGASVECRKQQTCSLAYADIMCSCDKSICSGTVLVETADLRSYLAEHDMNGSTLLSHFGGASTGDAVTVHITEYSQMTCLFRKEQQLNAVWDSKHHVCYGLLECPHCKKTVAIGIHLAMGSDSLAGKAFMDSRSVKLLPHSENNHEILN